MHTRLVGFKCVVAVALCALFLVRECHSQVIATLSGPTEPNTYTGVTYSTDGKLIAAIGRSRHRGAEIGARNKPQAPVLPYGQYTGHTVVIWDALKHRQVAAIEDAAYMFDAGDPATVISFVPNTHDIAIMSYLDHEYVLCIFDAAGKERRKIFRGFKNARSIGPSIAVPFAFSADGRKLAIGGNSKYAPEMRESCERHVLLVDIKSGEESGTLEVDGPVRVLEFSPDSKSLMVALSKSQNALSVWDVATRERLGTTGQRDGALKHATYLSNGNKIQTLSDAQSRIWTVPQFDVTIGKGDWRDATMIGYSRQSDLFAVCRPKVVSLFDSKANKLLGELGGYNCTSIAFSPDGKQLASAGDAECIVIWDCEAFRRQLTPTASIALGESTTGKMIFSPDSSTLGVLQRAGDIDLYNVTTREKRGSLSPSSHRSKSPYWGFQFLADGKHAVCWQGGLLAIWDLNDLKHSSIRTFEFPKEDEPVGLLALSDNAEFAAWHVSRNGSRDPTISRGKGKSLDRNRPARTDHVSARKEPDRVGVYCLGCRQRATCYLHSHRSQTLCGAQGRLRKVAPVRERPSAGIFGLCHCGSQLSLRRSPNAIRAISAVIILGPLVARRFRVLARWKYRCDS